MEPVGAADVGVSPRCGSLAAGRAFHGRGRVGSRPGEPCGAAHRVQWGGAGAGEEAGCQAVVVAHRNQAVDEGQADGEGAGGDGGRGRELWAHVARAGSAGSVLGVYGKEKARFQQELKSGRRESGVECEAGPRAFGKSAVPTSARFESLVLRVFWLLALLHKALAAIVFIVRSRPVRLG